MTAQAMFFGIGQALHAPTWYWWCWWIRTVLICVEFGWKMYKAGATL